MTRGMLYAVILTIAFGVFWFAYYKDIYLEGKKNADTLKAEGWKLYDDDKVDEAVAKFKKAIEKNAKYAPGYFGLGSCYNQKNDYEKAKDSFAKALEIKPDYHTARISYARCLMRLSTNKRETLKTIEQEIAKIPNEAYADPNVAYNFATLQSVIGHSRYALQYLSYSISRENATADDAKKDRDFDSIRNMPEFKRMVD